MRGRRLALLLLTGLLGAACVRFGSYPSDLAPDPVIAVGLNAIREKALIADDPARTALLGLKGLVALDPLLTLSRDEEGRILLSRQGTLLAAYRTPAANDDEGWSRLASALVQDSGSRVLEEAGPDGRHKAFFKGALSSRDRFSRYAAPAEAARNRAEREGFGGIGIRYQPTDQDIVITEILPQGPAAEARLEVGDHIIEADGIKLAHLSADEVSKAMRGPIDSVIRLVVRRGDDPPDSLFLRRALILIPTVTLDIRKGVAVLAISGFNAETDRDAEEALRQARAKDAVKGAILDLRGNPGGLFDQGVGLARLFLDRGGIVSTVGRHPESRQRFDAGPEAPDADIPLVLLIDGRTASAAEIAAAALEDAGRAAVIGSGSYGKGTVQTVIGLPDGGELILTWSRYVAPSGYALDGLGILPSLCTADGAGPETDRLKNPGGYEALLAAWRNVPVGDKAGRDALRRACPPRPHPPNPSIDDDPEIALALHLLSDSALLAAATPGTSGKAEPADPQH